MGAAGILPGMVQPSGPVAFEATHGFLDSVTAQLSATLAERRAEAPDEAAALVEELERLIGAGGKRIRPLFCYWGYRAAEADERSGPRGEAFDALVKAGAAIELVHTAAIVHDDLIDDSPRRRGVTSSHRHLAEMGEEDERLGRAGAILVGDLAQALADRALASCGFPPERVVEAFGPFTSMREDAAHGEFLDVLAHRWTGHAELRHDLERRVRRVAVLKSGSYTVTGPLLVGAALAAAPLEVRSALGAYGRSLGEAFQLRDDVLGLFGDPEVTGKDRDGDVRSGKETLLMTRARATDPAVERLLDARLGNPALNAREIEEVRTAVRDSGALAGVVKLIEELAEVATTALAVAVRGPTERALSELATLASVREA
jgi:geranylgeranyl diphosphate synthase type I